MADKDTKPKRKLVALSPELQVMSDIDRMMCALSDAERARVATWFSNKFVATDMKEE